MASRDQRNAGTRTTALAWSALSSAPSAACIGLLLLNDHVLKTQFDSALTGKLSDFAGLFFAPYFVLVVLGAMRLRQRPAILIAYGVVALPFVLLKCSPQTNAFVVELLRPLLPLQAVADSTDLLALPALVVSVAYLHKRSAQLSTVDSGARIAPHRPQAARRWSLFAAATVATLATSSARPEVSHLIADSQSADTAYATLAYSQADGVYMTRDAGNTWTRLTQLTGSIVRDPTRADVIYIVNGEPSWDLNVYRLNTTNGSAVSVRPPSPGARPQVVTVVGTDGLAIGGWAQRKLFLVRNGRALVSADEGATWTRLDAPDLVQAIAPARVDNVVYIVAGPSWHSGDLYRSDDAGASWQFLRAFRSNFAKLTVDPDDPNRLFVAVGKSLLRSGDGGVTWQEIYRYTGGGSEELARWLIEFDRANARIYLVFGFGCCRLMVSSDAGSTWTDAGISAAYLAVDNRGTLFVVDPSFTRVYVANKTLHWTETHSRLPLER